MVNVMQYLKYVLLGLLFIGFVILGVQNIRESNQKLQINEIELKSKETQLIELNQRYDKVLELKTDSDKEKEQQRKQIQELETERERLQRELQSKLDKQQAEQERLARAAKNASGVATTRASTVSGNKESWLRASGIPESDWWAVDSIVSRESSWNPNAVNRSSGACGLGQQLPCGKWPGAWNDPVTALKAQYDYVKARYGSYPQAVAFWNANHWY
jgi:hypothetical protein